MTKHRRIILAAEADLHGGSKGALLNPETKLCTYDKAGRPLEPQPVELNESQSYLWELRQENIKKTLDLAAGDDVMVIVNGDITQGNKHPGLLVSNRIADQIIIAAANLRPWLEHKNVVNLRIAVGTAAHNFLSGTAEVLVWEQFREKYQKKDIKVVYHGEAKYNGLPVDYAHHGPGPGIRNWLKGNIARLYLQSLMLDCVVRHMEPPALVLRAHYHVPTRAFNELDGSCSWLYILPSYSMLDDHATQAAHSPGFITHGMVAFEIVDGELVSQHKFYKEIDVRTKEEL